MKTVIVLTLILYGLKMMAQSDEVKTIDSVVSAMQETSLMSQGLFSLDSGIFQLTQGGRYAKFETSHYIFNSTIIAELILTRKTFQ